MKHNIEYIANKFKSYLDSLCEDYHFADYLSEGYCPEDLLWEWDCSEDACNDLGLQFGAGATRIVMWDEDLDYVIKFSPCFYGSCQQYGEDEVNAYKAATECGIEDAFAWCEKLFDYTFCSSEYGFCETFPIYVMEYCDCSEESLEDESESYHFLKYCAENGLDPKDEDSLIEFEGSNRKSSTVQLISYALHKWGRSAAWNMAFIDFVITTRINDLHGGNWGYDENGLLKLTDYAGYGERNNRRLPEEALTELVVI